MVPTSSEGGDTCGGAASAAFGLEGDPGLSLEAVLLLVLKVKREFVGAAVQEEELLRRRRSSCQTLVFFFCSSCRYYVCVCVYLLSAGVCEVDLVQQRAVHLADVRFGRLHVDHNPLLHHFQLQDRRAEFGCRCVRSSFISCTSDHPSQD